MENRSSSPAVIGYLREVRRVYIQATQRWMLPINPCKIEQGDILVGFRLYRGIRRHGRDNPTSYPLHNEKKIWIQLASLKCECCSSEWTQKIAKILSEMDVPEEKVPSAIEKFFKEVYKVPFSHTLRLPIEVAIWDITWREGSLDDDDSCLKKFEAPLTCAICLEDFGRGVVGQAIIHLACGHRFHEGQCLFPWTQRNRHCPLCRRQLF